MFCLWLNSINRLHAIEADDSSVNHAYMASSHQNSDEGKITLLDIGNNEIGPKGAFSITEYVKKTKSLLWLNLYMNDIGDEVWLLTIVALCSVASLLKHKLSSKFTNLKYSKVEIDEVRFK
ncbi:hypothetical protein ZIOFF_043442 [Zingiber officinale]|uniref:Uncharacterized protein n=1 Tax=Zingiber officinale TaxID=94328 RepID=A0A8J5FXB3_ZINOF|nr:hypothetical protein ZIOFF_043442 [Zingiber officinale]